MANQIKRGRGRPPGLRPELWKTGPDLERHLMFVFWMKMKAQAKFRGEAWALPFEDYELAWAGRWSQRGRAGTDLCMIRVDTDLPWSLDNTDVISRAELCARNAEIARSFR
jgi:hypothetical protein